MTSPRLLLVGSKGSSHVGESLLRAAHELGIPAELCDMRAAWKHGTIRQKLLWQFAGRRPVALKAFSGLVVEKCRSFRPTLLLATGTAPISKAAMEECRALGVRCANFSTDDPFNPRMRAPWFLKALPLYHIVFSPRKANIEELRVHGCGSVNYLPFGYDPDLFFPEEPDPAQISDLFFAGTAEASRAKYISAAIDNGFDVQLYGNYWRRYLGRRDVSRGQADVPTVRRGIASSKVALCVVRHDNRDGHSMRTFELPAVGACMVVEDTAEHRIIFGEDGDRVEYFSTPAEMIRKAQVLLKDVERRLRMREANHKHICDGKNTYAERLRTMLELS